jgi:hypothetical protein
MQKLGFVPPTSKSKKEFLRPILNSENEDLINKKVVPQRFPKLESITVTEKPIEEHIGDEKAVREQLKKDLSHVVLKR